MIRIANDWSNNYLTTETYADHNHISREHAERLIMLAMEIRDSRNPHE